MRCVRFISPHLSLAQKALQPLSLTRRLTSAATESAAPPSPPPLPPMPPSERVSAIADEISGLTLLEISDLVDVLRNKLDVKEMPIMGVMMPGVSFGGMAAGGAAASAAVPKGEVKEEKTVFDVKLEGFDAAAKIKVIKEVRGFTDLGLKEAKELVEKAPSVLKKGVSKEEAEKIIAKMKEVGAKVSME